MVKPKYVEQDGETLKRLDSKVWCRNCDYEATVWQREGETELEAVTRAKQRHSEREPNHAVRCDRARHF